MAALCLLMAVPACRTLTGGAPAAAQATESPRGSGTDRSARSARSDESVPMMAAQPQPSIPDGYPPVTFPANGDNRWRVAGSRGPVAGRSGTLLRYRVVVENGIGLDANQFATQVATILSDPRSWTGTGDWRLQLVGAGDAYDFTIFLATPGTRDRLCADGVDRYTSCRRADSVVLNVARWAQGVPHYGANLDVYREYMVNHEVGHRLGHGHELCPGAGRPAPVMEQQTLGLHGCVANAWPAPGGRLYAGPPGQYDDRPPAAG